MGPLKPHADFGAALSFAVSRVRGVLRTSTRPASSRVTRRSSAVGGTIDAMPNAIMHRLPDGRFRVTNVPEGWKSDGGDYPPARAAYLQRFPDSAPIFELGDFQIVALRPVSARLVAGFGRAGSLVGRMLEDWLREP